MADEAVNVRRATEPTRPSLRELWEGFEREVPEPAGFEPETWEEEWADTRDRSPTGGVFLADDDGRCGRRRQDRRAEARRVHVHLVYVVPRVRRQGVAKAAARVRAQPTPARPGRRRSR